MNEIVGAILAVAFAAVLWGWPWLRDRREDEVGEVNPTPDMQLIVRRRRGARRHPRLRLVLQGAGHSSMRLDASEARWLARTLDQAAKAALDPRGARGTIGTIARFSVAVQEQGGMGWVSLSLPFLGERTTGPTLGPGHAEELADLLHTAVSERT